MYIDIKWAIAAILVSILVGVVLRRWQRPVLPRLYVWITIIGTLFASYYILNVFFGSGRTGWP